MSLPTELPLLCGINKVLWGPSGRKTKTHYTVYAEPRGLEEISQPAEGWCHFMAGMTFLECTAPLNENQRGHGSPSAYREAVTIMRTDSSRDLDACISFPTFLFQMHRCGYGLLARRSIHSTGTGRCWARVRHWLLMKPFVCLERVHFRTIWLCRGLIRKHNVCALAVMWGVPRTQHAEPLHLCGPCTRRFLTFRGRRCRTDTVCIDPSRGCPASQFYHQVHPFKNTPTLIHCGIYPYSISA